MAIARDAAVATAYRGQTSPQTWNHTVASGGVLYVSVVSYAVADTVTGVTFDGTAMTLIKKQTYSTRTVYIYGLLTPTTGSEKTVSVSFNTAGSPYIYGGSISYTGVDTSGFSSVTPVSAYTSTPAKSISTSITTSVNNSAILGMCWVENGAISTYTGITKVGTNVQLFHFEPSAGLIISPAGSLTVGVTTPSNDWMALLAFVAEPASSSGPTHLKKLNGIASANIKKINGVPIANIKKVNSIT